MIAPQRRDLPTEIIKPITAPDEDQEDPGTPSLARASGSMVIANLVSRITGFGRTIMLAGVLGFGAINDSYTVSNNLPNIVYELLLGGVLAAVVIPVLVRAQTEDEDEGEAFTQRLLTMAVTVLGIGTVIAVACSPLLTKLYFSSTGKDDPTLTTYLSYLILPEIFFYGMFGLLSGILNARHVFKPAAWAPVMNNVIMFVTLGLYAVLPGTITLDPLRMTEPKLLVLGVGTTLGIVVQAAMLVPPLLKLGFKFRWRWGWDRRLSTFGKLAMWLVVYTIFTQIAQTELSRVATGATTGTVAIYSYSWLLLQVPYGVLGVSLLTAIMPRLSKAAATGDLDGIVDNLSIGQRNVTVMLGPVVGLMTVLGPQIGIALFAIRSSNLDEGAELGLSLTTSAFGIFCYAISMLQMRVFYAMNDARTPALINGSIVAVKVGLFYLSSHMIDAQHLVYALTFINGLGFTMAAILGNILLKRKIGDVDTGRVLRTILKVVIATVWGSGAALLISRFVGPVLPGSVEVRSWLTLILGSLIGFPIIFYVMTLLQVPEVGPVVRRLRGLVRR